MLNTIEAVIERIVNQYDPAKIILFGSHGTDRFRADSDIDLLIVKDTEKRLLDRQIEAELILSDRGLPLDIIVYTPDEVRYLFSIGSPFIEDIMETGRLLYMRKATQAWIKDAEEELDSSVILFEHEKYRGSCYHSQQCVEKGLKALILEKGSRPPKIHDIVELLKEATQLGYNTGLSIDDAVFLNSIYKGRYPAEQGLLPYGEPTKNDAEKATTTAKGLIEKIRVYLEPNIL